MPYAESLIRMFGQRSIAKLLIPCLNETVCQQIAAELQATDGELAETRTGRWNYGLSCFLAMESVVWTITGTAGAYTIL